MVCFGAEGWGVQEEALIMSLETEKGWVCLKGMAYC